ncbi:STAS domain-containing protein [Anoxybacillus salavatliensis]|uniref:STAS domain-containing protein n=1 Tax=Anoxybacillus gonensis TaxID=198467 RepID=UPI00214BC1BE|nr:STAS domain-containing protein [Anoxybacillus gonensis]MCQ5364877.1 STAS domain-containing protein [Anoxybacillus gonensis]
MGKFKIFYLQEDITLKNIEYLKRTMNKLVYGNCNCIILNMEKVKYINGIGLETIIKCAILAKKKKKELVITNIESPLKEIFQIVAFSIVIRLFDSDKEAIDYFYQNNKFLKTNNSLGKPL